MVKRHKSHNVGPLNPMWKGDEATDETIRKRLIREMPVPKGSDRHHIDGNIRNSNLSNIHVMTRREHMIIDGRMEALIKRNTSLENRNKISESMIGEKHYRWQGEKASAEAKYLREYRARKRKNKKGQ